MSFRRQWLWISDFGCGVGRGERLSYISVAAVAHDGVALPKVQSPLKYISQYRWLDRFWR